MHRLVPLVRARTSATAAAVLLLGVPLGPSLGAQVSWTSWSQPSGNTTSGTVTFGSTPVNVTFTGPTGFVQSSCGTNYWSPNVYTGAGVPNAPDGCGIIALNQGGAKTITFSQAVTNPLFAFLSWNGQGANPLTFAAMNGATSFAPQLSLINSGTSYWGSGSVSVSGSSLNISGEVGGTVELLGTYTQISFTDESEYWHGFTIGGQALGGATTAPEPETYALVAGGLLAVAGVARRRRGA